MQTAAQLGAPKEPEALGDKHKSAFTLEKTRA
jgi:hypothetical protein